MSAPTVPEIRLGTLLVAIQAVHHELSALDEEIREAGDAADPGLCELELSYWKAAENLREVYEERQKGASNFPPYEALVRSDEPPPETDPRSPS